MLITTSTESPLTLVCVVLTTVAMATEYMPRYNVSEEVDPGTFVGDFKRDYYAAKAAEGYDLRALRFALRTTSKYFRIDGVTGVIVTSRRIDREKLCARATPSCNPYDQILDIIVTPVDHFVIAKVKVTVIDANDNAPTFPVDDMTLDVWDNSPQGALFSVPYAEDLDSGILGVQKYSLEGGQDKFDLRVTDMLDGSHDVRIRLNGRLELDRQRKFNLTVIATDGGSPVRTGSLLVRMIVKSVAEARPTFERDVYAAKVVENSPAGRWVTQVQAGSSGSQSIAYSFADTGDRKPFRVDARTGSVYVSAPIDYELEHDIRLTVTATSGGRPAMTATTSFVIEVIDVNDNAPEISVNTLQRSGRGQVTENAPNGTFVAHVTVTDADSGENSWTACLTNSAIFILQELSASEYKLSTAVTFDREEEIQHKVKIVCHDFGTPSLTSSVPLFIDVLDANDNDPVFSRIFYSITEMENLPVNSLLLRVASTDADDGINAVPSYSISSLDTPPFHLLSMDAVTGEVRTIAPLDFETKSQYRFLLTVTDGGEPRRSGSATLTLDLTDTNDEPPRFSTESYFFNVVAERPSGSLLGRVQAFDADASEVFRNFTYSVETQTSLFQVDPRTGQLRAKQVLHSGDSYHFVVKASNSWSTTILSSTANVTVLVNGTLPVFIFPNRDNHSLTVDLDLFNVGDVVAEVRVQRRDDVTLRYAIAGGNDDRCFSIEEQSGAILLASEPEKGRIYHLTITVMDNVDTEDEVSGRLDVHVTSSSLSLLHLKSWLSSRESVMTMVGIVVGVVVLFILIIVGAVLSLRVRRKKSKSGEYNCRHEANRVFKGRSGNEEVVSPEDSNQFGVLLTAAKPKTPTKKKEVTFSLDDVGEEDDDEEEEGKMLEIYKGNQYIYSKSTVKSSSHALMNSPEDNESIGSDSGKGASEEGDSSTSANRFSSKVNQHPQQSQLHAGDTEISKSGSNLPRITTPPQLLPNTRVPPPPPKPCDHDHTYQPTAMSTFKTSTSPSYSPTCLRSFELDKIGSLRTSHSPGDATDQLPNIPTFARGRKDAQYKEYATDV